MEIDVTHLAHQVGQIPAISADDCGMTLHIAQPVWDGDTVL
ncbi:hypothetical protein SAMN04488020_1245 [Palleronia marisminoris]|uniref:Uncharacterized protein n=1 Tax=Palleronia marisminoris TaxID=315423 RepID=A0A1Y5TWT9_9RHOB|nr:hypothetical protein SAMN04488020_1245 [Palleronia marisminoris]SLN71894.1 hypothetical protein PAM7066_03694 [Palleronia marisminoris]